MEIDEAMRKRNGPLFLDQYSPLSAQKETEGFKISLLILTVEFVN